MLEGFSEQYLLSMGGLWICLFLCLAVFASLRPWKSPRRSVRLLAKTFFTFWVTGLLCLGLESAFALFYDTTDSFGLANTSVRWTQRHVQLNNMGFRDRKDFSLRATAGKRRVVLLGDSFTFGHGLADPGQRFGDLLEKRLPNDQLYNCSQPGLSTRGALQLLTQLLDRGLTADTVVYVYNLNDVEDLSEDSRYTIGTIILDKPQNIVLREAYLPNFLYYRYSQLSRPEVTDYFHWLSDAYQGEVWREQESQFQQLRTLCEQHSIRLMVVVFPFLHDLAHYRFGDAHATLTKYWQQAGIPVLDLLPVMQQHQSKNLVVNRYDAHPNALAHKIAAEAIWSELFDKHLPGTDASTPAK